MYAFNNQPSLSHLISSILQQGPTIKLSILQPNATESQIGGKHLHTQIDHRHQNHQIKITQVRFANTSLQRVTLIKSALFDLMCVCVCVCVCVCCARVRV